MTIREIMIDLIKQGRVIPYENTIKIYNQNGTEAKTLKTHNCNGNKPRTYWNVSINGQRRMIPISQLTWLSHGNVIPEGMTVDHIDRNTLNDSINNLRAITHAEQSQNRGNSKTTPETRNMMRERFNNKTGTIRGMAREYGLCREIVQDIIHKRYAYDQLDRQGN